MAKPRCIHPGAVYFITRRCAQRMFLLRPDPRTRQAFLYTLGLAASRTGVVLHAVCVMSNHIHLVATDPSGRIPEFLRELNRTTAKIVNAMHGRRENVWDLSRATVQRILDPQALLDRIAYTAANPTSAGLVRRPELWPGVLLWTPGTQVVKRPSDYFSPQSRCPEQIVLQIHPPETPWSEGEWKTKLKSAISARVFAAHSDMAKRGLRFVGVPGVLARAVTDRPATEAKRSRQPHVATSVPALLRRARADRARFLWEYREVLDGWCRGIRDVPFPAGTWWMVRHHGATTVAPPPSDLAA